MSEALPALTLTRRVHFALSRFLATLHRGGLAMALGKLQKSYVSSHRSSRTSARSRRVQSRLATLSLSLEDCLHPMSAHTLPNEIWLYVFELATAEYLPSEELPNSMDRSAWFKNVFGAWCLQSPDELVMNAQKRRYKTVKVRCTNLADARGTSSDVEHPGYPLNLQALAPYRRRILVQSYRGLQTASYVPAVPRFE